MSHSTIRIFFLATAFSCAWVWLPTRAHAESLENSLNTLADQVEEYLKDHNVSKVSVRTFDGPRTGTGRLMSTGLIERLKTKTGVNVVDLIDAQIEVRGRFSVNVDASLPFVLLEVGLFDTASGSESTEFRRRVTEAFQSALEETNESIAKADAVDGKIDTAPASTATKGIPIDNPKDVATIAAPTVDLTKAIENSVPVSKSLDTLTDTDRAVAIDNRNKALESSLKNPSFARVNDTIVAPSADSKFSIQVTVADTFTGPFEPFPILDRDGLAFAPFREGQFYSVTIINQADFDIGVELNIDGINTLAFSENLAFRTSGKWVIPSGRSGTVRGFHVNNRFVDAFQVVATAKGPVEEKFADPAKIGTITAAIHAAWGEGETPPKAAKIVGIPADLRTVRGPRIEAPSQSVTRVFCETALAFMSVRYSNPDPPSDLPLN